MKNLILVIGLVITLASSAGAQTGRTGWDGTWAGGWDRNAGVQLVFAGDKLIAFYWRGDYKDVLRTTSTPEGGKLFAWTGGEATLTRTPDGRAQLLIREGTNKLSVSLNRE